MIQIITLIFFTISVLVSGFCTNTSFAEKDDDKELTKNDVEILCDASEDYEAHKEQCDKLYDRVKDDDGD